MPDCFIVHNLFECTDLYCLFYLPCFIFFHIPDILWLSDNQLTGTELVELRNWSTVNIKLSGSAEDMEIKKKIRHLTLFVNKVTTYQKSIWEAKRMLEGGSKQDITNADRMFEILT